jgi:hypothetical protein
VAWPPPQFPASAQRRRAVRFAVLRSAWYGCREPAGEEILVQDSQQHIWAVGDEVAVSQVVLLAQPMSGDLVSQPVQRDTLQMPEGHGKW